MKFVRLIFVGCLDLKFKSTLQFFSNIPRKCPKSGETGNAACHYQNMEFVKFFIVLFIIFLFKYSTNSDNTSDEKAQETINLQNIINDNSHLYKKPTILIVSLVRNKAHTLPLFLTYLEEQQYPKDRISLWVATDHNEDNSREVLETWLSKVQSLYHSIHYQHDNSGEQVRKSETNQTHWPPERFSDLIRMKEEALEYARKSWADYVFVSEMIDGGCL